MFYPTSFRAEKIDLFKSDSLLHVFFSVEKNIFSIFFIKKNLKLEEYTPLSFSNKLFESTKVFYRYLLKVWVFYYVTSGKWHRSP